MQLSCRSRGIFHFIGQRPEFLGLEANHQADDVVCALQVEAVLVVIYGLDPVLLVALVAEEPSPGGIGHHAIRKSVFQPEQHDGGEGIDRIFLVPENRYFQFADEGMTGLMADHEQNIAGDELDALFHPLG